MQREAPVGREDGYVSASTTSGVDAIGGGNASGRATRERLVLTAERLFAERGIAAVSLREVGQAAGQRNNGATQYHFGDREGLVLAIFRYRASEHRARRLEVLQKIKRPATRDDTRTLIEALVEPMLADMRAGNHYVGFLAHAYAERGAFLGGTGDDYGGYIALGDVLRECLPDLPEELFVSRLASVTAWMAQALASRQHDTPSARMPIDVFVADLVSMLTQAMLAPPA